MDQQTLKRCSTDTLQVLTDYQLGVKTLYDEMEVDMGRNYMAPYIDRLNSKNGKFKVIYDFLVETDKIATGPLTDVKYTMYIKTTLEYIIWNIGEELDNFDEFFPSATHQQMLADIGSKVHTDLDRIMTILDPAVKEAPKRKDAPSAPVEQVKRFQGPSWATKAANAARGETTWKPKGWRALGESSSSDES